MTPLLAWSGVIFPYTTPKALAFRVLVEIAAVFYFYLALRHPQRFFWSLFSCHCEPSVAGRSNPAGSGNSSGLLRRTSTSSGLLATTAVVLFFLLVNFLSALFGTDFYASFWGNLERGMGVWSLVHFVAWFLMLLAVFRERKDWQRLIKLSVAVSVLVAITALIQRFGGFGELLPTTDRIYGVIGNAGILAGYLIFNIFLAGYLFFESIGWKKWFFAISGCLLAIGLLLTGTRGAYLGLMSGIIVLCAFLFFTPLFKGGMGGFKELKKWPIICLVIIFVFIVSLFLFRDSNLVKNNAVLARLTSFSFSDATIQSRLILWQDSWRAWQTRPLLGFGPENFESAISKYLSPRLASFEAYGTDRSHNLIFDYGVAIGWLGLLSYLMMIGAAGWSLILFVIPAPQQRGELQRESSIYTSLSVKGGGEGFSSEPGFWVSPSLETTDEQSKPGMTEKEKPVFPFSVIFISLLVAYLVQNFFIFDSFVSYLMLFFV
ncbi:MAG: O-antigen ligase family protein, partial [Candidatus Komeilibacteria bacterium]